MVAGTVQAFLGQLTGGSRVPWFPRRVRRSEEAEQHAVLRAGEVGGVRLSERKTVTLNILKQVSAEI